MVVTDVHWTIRTFYMKCNVCGKIFESKTKRKTCGSHCAWILGKRTKKKNKKLKKRVGNYKGTYKGFKCDSRWELAFLIYCLDKGKPIQRCNEVFEYQVKGKTHKYYPDFQIKHTIIEIKGKYRKNLKLKLQAVEKQGYKIVLIDKDKIQPYLKYCYKKYKTERLEKLYD